MRRDALALSSNGALANLTEAFLGSYELDWKVVRHTPGGSTDVQIDVRNTTTISSATPNDAWKREGDGNAASGADARPFEHYQNQHVTWIEHFYR